MNTPFRSILFLCLSLLILPCAIAQEGQGSDDSLSEEPTTILETGSNENSFKRGDNLFSIQLGAFVPLFFNNLSTGAIEKTNLYVGGILSLRYMGFVSTGFALGGELGASFTGTIAGRTLYTVPFSFEATWLPTRMPFEFPIGIGIGGAIFKLGDAIHVDPVLKPQLGIFYRASPSWSFGGMLSYLWVPQFYADPSQNYFGNFLTVNLSVINHL